MVKNIIFDLGNVVLSFDPYQYFIDDFQDEQKTRDLCNAIFTGEIWNEYDRGSYTKEALYAVFLSNYPHWEQEIRWILDKWVALLTPMDLSVRLMKLLKASGYHVFIMSNINEEAHQYLLKNTDIFSLVDGMILSYVERINKPDSQIYERLMKRYQLKAEECVFIDDRKDNIEMAKQLHMHGIVYLNHKQVVDELSMLIDEGDIC